MALNESGGPNFNLLQNFHSAAKQISYFGFDLPVFKVQDLTSLALVERRSRMRSLLGNCSIKLTEKHYAPWMKNRQDALDRVLEKVAVAE